MEKLLRKTTRNGLHSLRNYRPKLSFNFSSKSNNKDKYLRFGTERYIKLKSRCLTLDCYGGILNWKTAERKCSVKQKHLSLAITTAHLCNFRTSSWKRFHSNESWLDYKFDEGIFGHGTHHQVLWNDSSLASITSINQITIKFVSQIPLDWNCVHWAVTLVHGVSKLSVCFALSMNMGF